MLLRRNLQIGFRNYIFSGFANFLNFHQIFHRCTLNFANTPFDVLKLQMGKENMKTRNPTRCSLQPPFKIMILSNSDSPSNFYYFTSPLINAVLFCIEWLRQKTAGSLTITKKKKKKKKKKKNRKIVKDTCKNVFLNFTVPRACACVNYHGGCVKHVLSGIRTSFNNICWVYSFKCLNSNDPYFHCPLQCPFLFFLNSYILVLRHD